MHWCILEEYQYGMYQLQSRCRLGRLRVCASNPLMWVFYVALCSGRAWIEEFGNTGSGEIGAPFEVAPLDRFEECWQAWAE